MLHFKSTLWLLLLVIQHAVAQQSRLGDITNNVPDGPGASCHRGCVREHLFCQQTATGFRTRSPLYTRLECDHRSVRIRKSVRRARRGNSRFRGMWSDNATTVRNLTSGTATWGGCFPHMQILHKGTKRRAHWGLMHKVHGRPQETPTTSGRWSSGRASTSRAWVRGTRWAPTCLTPSCMTSVRQRA